MKFKYIVPVLFLALFVVTCQQSKVATTTSSARTLSVYEAGGYHNSVEMTVGWIPYTQDNLVKEGDNLYRFVKGDTTTGKKLPAILLKYPATQDSIWLDMTMSNEDLGNLIKHTLMTEVVIKRPFAEFYDEAQCSKCHPSHVEIDE